MDHGSPTCIHSLKFFSIPKTYSTNTRYLGFSAIFEPALHADVKSWLLGFTVSPDNTKITVQKFNHLYLVIMNVISHTHSFPHPLRMSSPTSPDSSPLP